MVRELANFVPPDSDRIQPGSGDAGVITRWMSVVVAGLCVLGILLNLNRPAASGWVRPRIVLYLGLLASMSSIVAKHRRAKTALAVCGVILATAALLFQLLSA